MNRHNVVMVGGGHDGLAGGNWLRLFRESFGPMPA